jgi:hypothetical protein
VHRAVGQQCQDRCPHVTAPPATWTATAASAASAASEIASKTGAETRAETGAKTGTKARAETKGSLLSACLVVTEVFDEFLSGVPPGAAVYRTSLRGTGAEAEAWAAGEWPDGRSELVVHVCSPYVC